MTADEKRALLGLGPDVSDAAVEAAYQAYVASLAPQPGGATPASLKARYAAFAAVPDATVQVFLDDALPYVADFGDEADRGQMLLAAHYMVQAGTPGIVKTATEQIPAGVTRFRSASMDVAVSEAAANRSIASGYAATWYGVEFAKIQRRHLGAPRLVGYVEPLGLCWS